MHYGTVNAMYSSGPLFNSRGWRLIFALHSDFRIILVVFVVIAVPFLILHRGSDALNVCMNSVCLLFILEVKLNAIQLTSRPASRPAEKK